MAKMALMSTHTSQWIFHGRGQVAGPLPAELPEGCLLSPDFLGEKETETLLVEPAKTFSISSRPLAILSDTQHGVLCQNYAKDNCVLCSVGEGIIVAVQDLILRIGFTSNCVQVCVHVGAHAHVSMHG